MSPRTMPLTAFIGCLRGPTIWAAHFFILYGAETIVCMTASAPAPAMRLTVLAATVIALVVLGLPFLRVSAHARLRDDAARDFMRTLSISLSALSAAAMLAAAVAAWRLPACLPPAG